MVVCGRVGVIFVCVYVKGSVVGGVCVCVSVFCVCVCVCVSVCVCVCVCKFVYGCK